MSQMTVVEAAAAEYGWPVVGHVGPSSTGWIARWYSGPGSGLLYVRYSQKGVVTRAAYGNLDRKGGSVKIDGKDKAGQIAALIGAIAGSKIPGQQG